MNLQAGIHAERTLKVVRQFGLTRLWLVSGEPVDPVPRCLPALSELLCEPLAVRTFRHERDVILSSANVVGQGRLALRGGFKVSVCFADHCWVSGIRGWVVGIAGAAAIAAAVLWASEQQRSTAERNFKEAQAAAQMQVAMLSQERGLDAYLATGKPQTLQLLFQSKLQLTTSLVHARALSRDDRLERAAVEGQADAFRNWSSLANAAMRRR